jgi:acyl carrier protein
MITAETAEKKLKGIVATALKCSAEEILPGTRFREDLGADSLDLIVILHEVEGEFDVEVPDARIGELKTFGDALKYIHEMTQSS